MTYEELKQEVIDYTKQYEEAVEQIGEELKWAAKMEAHMEDAKLAVLKYELTHNL